MVAHASNRNTIYSFNMAFIDGHVTTVNDKILATFKTGAGIQWPSTANVASKDQGLYALDDDLDILETEADGRDPFTSNADPFLPRFDTSGGAADPYIFREQNSSSSNANDGSHPSDTDHPFVPWL